MASRGFESPRLQSSFAAFWRTKRVTAKPDFSMMYNRGGLLFSFLMLKKIKTSVPKSAQIFCKPRPVRSNGTISVAVTAPQFSPSTGAQVNRVSFGLENPPIPGGPIRAWYWNCSAAGSGAPITWNTPTVITIDTSNDNSLFSCIAIG